MKCPKCGSNKVVIGSKDDRIITGSSFVRVLLRCEDCGHTNE